MSKENIENNVLSDEELEKVSGGDDYIIDIKIEFQDWKCNRCGSTFSAPSGVENPSCEVCGSTDVTKDGNSYFNKKEQ